MSRLGIIPAGGRSVRFGGTFKELLPVGDYSLLQRTVGVLRAGAAVPIVVLTTPSKAAAHMRGLEGFRGVCLLSSGASLFESIMAACEIPAPWYLFAMPDTFLPEDAFYRKFEGDFMLGLFETDKPERFGAWNSTGIIDKDESLRGSWEVAWGVAAWSQGVVNYWRSLGETIQDHTQAFNLAIARFGCTTFGLDFYYDMASWPDYENLVANVLPTLRD